MSQKISGASAKEFHSTESTNVTPHSPHGHCTYELSVSAINFHGGNQHPSSSSSSLSLPHSLIRFLHHRTIHLRLHLVAALPAGAHSSCFTCVKTTPCPHSSSYFSSLFLKLITGFRERDAERCTGSGYVFFPKYYYYCYSSFDFLASDSMPNPKP